MHKSQFIHKDLLKEMQDSKINKEHLLHFMESQLGKVGITKKIKEMSEKFEKFPELKHNPDFHSWSKEEMMIDRIKKLRKFHEEFNNNIDDNYLKQYNFYNVQLPLSIHYAQFIPTVKSLGSEEQQAKWLPMIENHVMLGAYAQTELAHGSDIQNLQTTAVFDKTKDEFILNTPTIESIKFWPGELGIYANHALVFAQLYIDNNHYGLNCFMVRIRDDNHQPMPGVKLGDIGAKFGFNGKDNGYMELKDCRIKRIDMLSRFASVDKDGEFTINGDPRAMYAGMMEVRSLLSLYTWHNLAGALVIATRYSVFRKQFKNGQGKEQAIINYQLQQEKLLSQWCRLYAMIGSGNTIRRLVSENSQLIKKENKFNKLKETHITLAGFKFYFTDMITKGIEVLRLACGGHGFHHYSQLPSMRQETLANITLEGENTVMCLQVSKFLLKQMIKVRSNKVNTKEYMKQIDYIYNYKNYLNQFVKFTDFKQLYSIPIILNLLTIRACNLVNQMSVHYENLIKNGSTAKSAWDKYTTIQGVESGKCHVALHTFQCFASNISEFYEQNKDQSNKEQLTELCLLFGVESLLENCIGLVEVAGADRMLISQLEELKEHLIAKLRPELVSIAESFQMDEISLRFSPLGRQDGRVYESFLELAQANALNSTAISKGVQAVLELKQASIKRNSKL